MSQNMFVMITQDSTLNKQISNERLARSNLFILFFFTLCNNNFKEIMKEKKYYLVNGQDAKKMYFKAQCSINKMEELGVEDYWIDYCKIDSQTLYSWTKEYIKKDEKYRKKLSDKEHLIRCFKFMSLTYIDEETRMKMYEEEKLIVERSNFHSESLFYILNSLLFYDYDDSIFGFIPDVKMTNNSPLFNRLVDDYLYYIKKNPRDNSIFFFFISHYNYSFSLGLDEKLKEILLKNPSLDDYRNMIRLSSFNEMIEKTSSLGLALEYYSIFHNLLNEYEIGLQNKSITLDTILSLNINDYSFSGLLLDTFEYNKVDEFNMLYEDAIKIFKSNLKEFYHVYICFALFNAIYKTSKQNELMAIEDESIYKEYMSQTYDFFWEAFRYLVGFNVPKDENKAYKILNSQEKKIGSFMEKNFSIISVFKGNFSVFQRKKIPLYKQIFDVIKNNS